MTKKYFKLLLSLGIILCILCGSLTMTMAAPGWGNIGEIETDMFDDTDESTTAIVTEEETTKEPTTQRPSTTRPQTTKPDNTVNNTVKVTEKTTKENTKQTTKQPTKAESTTQVVTETTDPEEALLPEGSFFVYLERNNGERRLKTVLDKPGLIENIPNDPIRPGYIFKGWYADSDFKTPWDFSKSIAKKGTIIYAKWEPNPDTVVYNITIKETPGGKIIANPGSASVGEVVIITYEAEAGKRLVKDSITVNGKSIGVSNFIMPRGDVVISAQFEDAPEEIIVDEEKSFVVPIIIAVAVLIVAVVIIVIIRYKTRPAVIEYDENGAIILDDDDDDGWVDESIVISDGFSNGRIVRESSDMEDMDNPNLYDTDDFE